MNKKTMADDLDPLDPLDPLDHLSSYIEDPLDPLSGFEVDIDLLKIIADEEIDLSAFIVDDSLSDYPDDDSLSDYPDDNLDRDAFMRCRLGR